MCESPSAGTKRPLPDSVTDHKHSKRQRGEASSDSQDPPDPPDDEVFVDSSWLYMDCSYCNKHMTEMLESRFHGEKIVLQMHAKYSVFSKSSRGYDASREEVKIFKDEFLRKVCSLRNMRGGVLIIHVTEKSVEKGPSLDDFDQKVGEELSRMVEDDTMYVENYDRRWYMEQQTCVDKHGQSHNKTVYLDYIIVSVKGSSSVSTKDFNTLVTWDGSKERPKAREISRLLWKSNLQPCFPDEPMDDCEFVEGERVDLYESRDIQLKRLFEKDLVKDLHDHPSLADKSLAYRIAFRLTEKLHLLEYLTSFTKLKNGGSFFCGIEEEKIVMVMEKSKSSKKNKKKKKKGHGLKAGTEEDKDEVDSSSHLTAANVPVGAVNTCDCGSSRVATPHVSDAGFEVITHISSLQRLHFVSGNEKGEIELDKHCTRCDGVKTSDTRHSTDSNLVPNATKQNQDISISAQESNAQRKPTSTCTQSGVSANCDSSQGNGNHEEGVENAKSDVPSVLGTMGSPPAAASADGVVSQGYKTGYNIAKGITLMPEERLELHAEIMKCVQEDMLWLRSDGSVLTREEIAGMLSGNSENISSVPWHAN
ncbi:uncharacterized protein LOC124274410 isoform X2 [Haliotis rubra]|uniref:uncharacterized protein LOC124274410 isoform X2 n=1 Tax=Haliotis rubra TaxID=36100 RepID=UPI001EE5A22D|nr:uncharacterized protein LOC124274410 isoform X2 [Haliotis rubra]